MVPRIAHAGCLIRTAFCLALLVANGTAAAAPAFERVQYRNPQAKADLGVGLWSWPLPMDYDGDGDLDLVVACPDKPFNGTYFFENTSGKVPFPVFRAPRWIGPGRGDLQVSYVAGQPRVLIHQTRFRSPYTALHRGSGSQPRTQAPWQSMEIRRFRRRHRHRPRRRLWGLDRIRMGQRLRRDGALDQRAFARLRALPPKPGHFPGTAIRSSNTN
jgi:hypothetical protein